MTQKPSKEDQVFFVRPVFISRSENTGLQVSVCIGYDLCRPG